MIAVSGSDAQRIGDFLKTRGKRLMFYHRDTDGVASAALMLKFFPDFEHSPRKGPMMDRDFIEGVIRKEPDLLVFLDLPVDQETEGLGAFSKELPRTRIVVIDHHIFERNLNSEGIIHVNPRFQVRGAYIPASYLVYDIMEKLGKPVEPLMWMACVGIVGDYGFDDCRDFLQAGERACPFRDMKQCSDMISSAITLKDFEGANRALGLLLRAGSCADFLQDRELGEWHGIVEEEIRRIVEDFRDGREEQGTVLMYEIKSELSISSVIATILAKEHPDKVILVRKKSGDGWKLSLRYQAGLVNLGDLVKQCVKGMGSGGGHEKAAGALTSNWKVFRERFLSAVRKGHG